MKRLITTFVVVAFIINFFSIAVANLSMAHAAGSISLTTSNVNGYKGKIVTVAVNITADSNISAATINVNYDSSKLLFDSANLGTGVAGMLDANSETNIVKTAYVTDTVLTANGTFMELKFKIKDGMLSQTIPITLSVVELADENGVNLPFTTTAGSIKVVNYILGDISCDSKISSMDALNALQLSTGKLKTTESNFYAGDVNLDAKISSMDALKLLQFSTGKVTGLGGSTYTQQNLAKDISFSGAFLDTQLVGAGVDATFETTSVPSSWTAFGGGTLSVSSTVAHSGTKSLMMSSRSYTWSSPAFNLYNTFKTNGAGTYNLSFWVYVDSFSASPQNGNVLIRGNSAADANSFIVNNGGTYYSTLASNISTPINTWVKYSASINVLDTDLERTSGFFNMVIGSLEVFSGQRLYIDDFQLTKLYYSSPFDQVTMDVTFTSPNNTTMVMPAFWDGNNTWKVRFAPTMTGTWSYTTACNDTANAGLNAKTGTMSCLAYTGSLDIYKHGFVKTLPNTRYFVYDDGTPFFYMGDTHWTMPGEPYSTMFQPLVDQRAAKGITVYQSEPLGATYSLWNGLDSGDIAGFQDMDNRFAYIANAGMVHANAQLFFASELSNNAQYYSTEYLQKLARYWVARYAAYPVMWTTAQEVDNDFYGVYDIATSPWKTVFNAMHQFDPYQHPQTAHQENVSHILASTSAYKDLPGYSWFSAQWAPAKNAQLDFNIAKDYWNTRTCPSVNYEGHYEYLWTNEFGARHQGWTAYLNGMYGQGYGAQDIWCYNTDYNEDVPSNNYGALITVEMKAITWETSKDFNTPLQLGTYMKGFFQTMNWWQLTPRFNDTTWFANNSSYYSVASIDNDAYVAYFYNTTTNTGTLKNMDATQYTAKWYNPSTGVYTDIGTITPSSGRYTIPAKPDSNDWVLYVYHS